MQIKRSLPLSLFWSVSHQIKFCIGKNQKPTGSLVQQNSEKTKLKINILQCLLYG